MTAPNQIAHDAAVAASTARFLPEQSELLSALRSLAPTLTNESEIYASELSTRLEDLRHNARCLASAMAYSADPSPYVEALRAIGAEDAKK